MRPTKSASFFTRFAKWTAHAAGRPAAFCAAAAVVVIWGATGPLFKFSDTWQLVINTGTTIVTFLMVFLIQNTQNRDTEALQVKLDELIRVTEGAHLVLLDLEELDDKQLDHICGNYQKLAKKARESLERGEVDTGTPELNPDEEEEARALGGGKKSGRGSKKSK
ncbi:MAG TPA: low affinity iron permease family protein [Pyrinomonadaceae bacterium]|jgi:low affinity Fe/Cu permease|nr:low affinity iron permease family protein [Pyrinomonadaceae bacterium]